MHAYLLLAALAAPAFAQQINGTWFTGLGETLNRAGFTSLASIAGSLANSTNGTAFFSQLSQGQKTIFAPNNAALSAVPGNISSNPNLLVSIFSYHVLDGHFNASSFAAAPNHTIARSYLNGSDFALLEGNRSQVIVATIINNVVTILEAARNTTVTNSTTYDNVIIHGVDNVLIPPNDLSDTLEVLGLTSLDNAAESTNQDDALELIRGGTFFAPTNAAFTTAQSSLGPQAQNTTLISSILANHVINGTSVYSSGLTSQSFASAGGQAFQFLSNSSGTYVTSGQSTARIVRADVPVENGVVHIIDGVLANTESNPAAASSAAASQASVAATATSIPGQTAGGSGPAPSGSPSNNASLRTAGTLPITAAVMSVVVAGMGAFLGGVFVL